MTEAQRRLYWQELREDYEEFKVSHRQESRSRFKYVPARLLTLPGLVLYELEKRKFIENNGAHSYRPLK